MFLQKVNMASLLLNRYIVCVFYLFVTIAGHWGFWAGPFLDTDIKTYFKLYWKWQAAAVIPKL